MRVEIKARGVEPFGDGIGPNLTSRPVWGWEGCERREYPVPNRLRTVVKALRNLGNDLSQSNE